MSFDNGKCRDWVPDSATDHIDDKVETKVFVMKRKSTNYKGYRGFALQEPKEVKEYYS